MSQAGTRCLLGAPGVWKGVGPAWIHVHVLLFSPWLQVPSRVQPTGRPKISNHHFKKHLGIQMATDTNLLWPWFNCSTTCHRTRLAQAFKRLIRRQRRHSNLCENALVNLGSTAGVTARGRFFSSSTCSGFPGVIDCTSDKLQIQYGVRPFLKLGPSLQSLGFSRARTSNFMLLCCVFGLF